ncbi:TetR/AcrR family transcriptional regulator [Rhodococcus sp. IEGM 1379]|uniref:TetR/AcrR family transcriptional regulator n=1 Tax=Rhodococcus sp. IEGM 1379 TaxID=3047086 RepID=UPI0024B6EA89|nr:TetR/AcrR family transcriptional regulator [Rhodococcus sp. IEGM 1379]MDI9916860.1 TetR/AcrR family transcriptional regulator [Rhodococcus sp. IEGM 1379]
MDNSIDTAVSASAGTGTRTSGRPLQKRAQITHDTIVEAAASQFNTLSYAAAVNGIVELASSTKGSVYFHFSSKKALAHRLVQVWGKS